MMAPKNAILYPRVSSQKQLDNASLPTQRGEMERFAEREGYAILRVFEDKGRSAKTTNRPALQDMLRWIADRPHQVDAVLVYDFNRAARNLEDHLAIRSTLKKHGVKLISVTQPVTDDPHGLLLEHIHAAVAQHENSIRGQRSKLGMANATERGRWCHQAPVGYLNCGKNATPSLRLDTDLCEFVQEAFSRVAAGESPAVVHGDLSARGFRTRRGGAIGRQTFYRMLHNEVYKGELCTKLGAGEGDWEPLIDPVVWDRVQSVLSKPDQRAVPAVTERRGGKRPYRRVREGFELRSSLRCACCRRRITGGVTKEYSYMNCPDGHVRVRAEVLNVRFREWLASVRPSEVFLRSLENAIRRELEAEEKSLSKRRARNQRAAANIRSKLKNLNMALADGTMEHGAYRTTYRELKAGLGALEHADVDDELEQFDVEAALNFARRLLSQPDRWWGEASPEDKIRLQKALFPNGLLVDEALQFSTDPTLHDSVTYLLFGGGASDMASPTGFEPVSQP